MTSRQGATAPLARPPTTRSIITSSQLSGIQPPAVSSISSNPSLTLPAENLQQQQRVAAATVTTACRVSGSQLKNQISFKAPSQHASSRRVASNGIKVDLDENEDESQQSGMAHDCDGDGQDGLSTVSRGSAQVSATLTKGSDIDIGKFPFPKERGYFPHYLDLQQASLPSASQSSTGSTATKRMLKPKPYNLEPPPQAPRIYIPPLSTSNQASGRLASGQVSRSSARVSVADFYAWTGDGPEDQWNDSVIKHGYFDKQSANELQGALRHSAQLKQKQCLHQLSSLLLGAQNQRRNAGRISSPSSFKPPPRMIHTDSKRESWLLDLSDPTVSLRKLSRAIPHGIKNEVFLHECLSKRIPAERAVWLAKCVGANDLRSFRRKGVTGRSLAASTAKWTRDWTVCVEGVVEQVAAAVTASTTWKEEFSYIVRLAFLLHHEHLLDEEHYNDWLVTRVEISTITSLFIWIPVALAGIDGLLRVRKTGQRLAAVLLAHVHELLLRSDYNDLTALSNRLKQFVDLALRQSPDSFVAPIVWLKYRDSLQQFFGIGGTDTPIEHQQLLTIISAVNARNEQLAASPLALMLPQLVSTDRQILISILDSTMFGPLSPDIGQQIWNINADKQMVVTTILDWATCIHRPGASKTYFASRLLRSWGTHGLLDVTDVIMVFARSLPANDLSRKSLFYHLVSELVRSKTFDVVQLLKSFFMSGASIGCPSQIAPGGPACTRMLVELPVHSLSDDERSLRNNWLERAGFALAHEQKDFEGATRALQRVLVVPAARQSERVQRTPLNVTLVCDRIKASNQACKAHVGAWLRHAVSSSVTCQSDGTSEMQVSAKSFKMIRQLLEAASDYSTLMDIIKLFSTVSNIDILTACVDSIDRHFTIFNSIGVCNDLFITMYDRFRAVATEQFVASRSLLVSVATLAARLPHMDQILMQLRHELVSCDTRLFADVPSPMSDSILMQNARKCKVQEQVERVIATGVSIDHPTLERLFVAVQNRLKISWFELDDGRRTYALLLARLRLCDPIHFDSLLSHYMGYVRSLHVRPPLKFLFPLLVNMGCLDLSMLLSISLDNEGQPLPPPALQSSNTQHAPLHAPQPSWYQEVLSLIMVPVESNQQALTVLDDEECYRYATMQRLVQETNSKEVVALIRQALIEWSLYKQKHKGGRRDADKKQHDQDYFELSLDEPDIVDHLTSLVRTLTLNEPDVAIQILTARWPYEQLESLMNTVAHRLLLCDDVAGSSVETEVKAFNVTDDFTMPFFQLRLSIATNSLEAFPMQDELSQDREQLLDDLYYSLIRAVNEPSSSSWVDIMGCVGISTACRLKHKAEQNFVGLIPSGTRLTWTDKDIEEADTSLVIISAALAKCTDDNDEDSTDSAVLTQFSTAVTDKLADLWATMASDNVAFPIKLAITQQWLPRVVRLLSMLVSLQSPPSSLPARTPAQEATTTIGPETPTTATPTMVVNTATTGIYGNTTATGMSAEVEIRARLCLSLAGIIKDIDAMPWDDLGSQKHTYLSPLTCEADSTAISRLRSVIVGTQTCLSPTSLAAQMPPLAVCSSRLYDLGIVIADGLTNDARAVCKHHLQDAASDPRLRYMFSIRPSPSEGIVLELPATTQPGDEATSKHSSLPPPKLSTTPGKPKPTPPPPQQQQQQQQQHQQHQHQQQHPITLPFAFRHWEILQHLGQPGESSAENDTCPSLTLFDSIKLS